MSRSSGNPAAAIVIQGAYPQPGRPGWRLSRPEITGNSTSNPQKSKKRCQTTITDERRKGKTDPRKDSKRTFLANPLKYQT
ncbi:hypothetical protein P7K49_007297 [Saguinus oedipus]|uniref:Uncharacterized protein n=1 Tax=Saguinus oedipus TaxID=9490 RepID=A0ABQ9VV61_SAGOE|nr:hypothetical protein P7K49_007297 [Saguinus oedipus]